MENQNALIAQFIEFCGGVDKNVAEFYLSSSDWNLEDAISNFLGGPHDDEMEPRNDNTENTPAPPAAPATSTSASTSPAEGAFGKTTAGGSAAAAAKPKFASMSEMTKRERKSDEEEGQAFYAGGSDRSGQQVLGPPKRKNFKEQLTDMFRMAQEQSNEIDPNPTPSTSSGITWGQGMRLGMTDTDHSVVATQSDGNTTDKRPTVVLKLWSQGFSVNNGELRPYDDPTNKEFLETVMRGEIPAELLEVGWMVNVDVEDHRNENYKKAPPKKTFKGSGHTLGSPTPNVEATVVTTAAASPAGASDETAKNDNTTNEDQAKDRLKLDKNTPNTTLQIRLADGSRLAAQFNLTHTVADIHQYIQTARPQYASVNFLLVSSFPTRELKDTSVTIEEANLKNASLMQRIV